MQPPKRHHLTLAQYRALRAQAEEARRRTVLRRAVEGAREAIERASIRIGMKAQSITPAEFPVGGLPQLIATPVREQPDGDRRCTSYAVGAAMELLCCRQRQSATGVPHVSVRDIFARAGEDLDGAVTAARAGVVDERCWPDTATKPCANAGAFRWRATFAFLNVDGPKVVPTMRRHVSEVGPLIIAIPIFPNFDAFRGSGVYRASGTAEAAHALCIVGYERAGGTDVWLVRNSYGDEWGDGGYGRLRVNDPDLDPEAVVYSSTSLQHPL